jgi:hypothetical protein
LRTFGCAKRIKEVEDRKGREENRVKIEANKEQKRENEKKIEHKQIEISRREAR